MSTSTFFDLQRFADDVLVRGAEGFTWQGGSSFSGYNSKADESTIGTPDNPARLSTSGLSVAGTSTSIVLNGTTDGYTFGLKSKEWELRLEDRENAIQIDLAGSHSLTGTADVILGEGEVFNETVNGNAAYIKVNGANTVEATASDGGITYSFQGDADKAKVGLDEDDTVVFAQGGDDVTLGAAGTAKAASIGGFDFSGAATVTASVIADSSYIGVAVNEGVSVTAGDETWSFDNKKASDVAHLTTDAKGNVTAVDGYNVTATVTPKKDLNTPVTVQGQVWDEISGKVNSVTFLPTGNAIVHNTGAVTVEGSESANVYANLYEAGVTANGAKIQNLSAVRNPELAIDLAEEGIDGIATGDASIFAKVTGDKEFAVGVANASYSVATTAENVSLYASDNIITMDVEANKAYTVTGGEAAFGFADSIAAHGSAQVSINGAAVTITNNGSKKDNYAIGIDKGDEGISGVMALKANDAINVSGDKDGYKVIFDAKDASGVVTFTANGKTVSVNADDVENITVNGDTIKGVMLTVDGKDNVLVEGIDSDAIVTVSAGTYFFNDKKAANKVVASDTANVSIVAGVINPVVNDYRKEGTQPAVDADDEKWDEISTIGGSTDTVAANHSTAYEAFYALDASSSVLSFTSDEDTVPTSTTGGVIEITGDTILSDAAHVTLDVNAGGGTAPLNIQANEGANVVDVKIDLTGSNEPSTVAIGTTGGVAASHDVSLSNASGGYAYLGSRATGQNKLTGGTGADMLRHEGTTTATILGGAGQDTIRADVNDVVAGGDGKDYFFDTAAYALDYNVSEGDVIIASRVSSFNEITADKIRGTGNQIGFGEGKKLLTLSNLDANAAVHVKVALLDDDGNLLPNEKDIVLANGNGIVEATAAGDAGAIVVADSIRGANGTHTVIGSAGKDSIYIGSNDFADGGAGNDYITIDEGATNASVSLGSGTGQDTIKGWNFGFANGKTVLETGGTQVRARVYEDMLHISLQGAAEGSKDAILLEDTKEYNSDKGHGQYDVLVGDKKYTAIRNNGDSDKGEDSTSKGYAIATNNGEVADFYVAERNGKIIFTDGVTKSFTGDDAIHLGSDNENQSYFAIREFDLGNNSKAQVIGTSERETVTVGGAAIVGANKEISLAGGNDVIVSSGDDSLKAGHKFFFGAGDGRDTIQNFSHYDGVDDDPDKQHTDTIVLQSYTGLKVDKDENGVDRIEIGTTDSDRVVVYEADGVNVDKMYRIQVGFDAEAKIAKIGHSEGGNNFTYDKKVAYYLGASGDAHDTLTIADTSENVEVWLDGHDGGFYRGIDVVDASAETYTNISIAGSADNNTITAGGEGTTNFLWGGAGDNSLIGGDGIDYFLYYQNSNASIAGATSGTGNNDTIEGFNATQDFIYLGDVTIDDIDVAKMAANGEHAGIAADGVRVDFKNGGSLTVNVTDQEYVRFYMNNGDVYSARREDGAWHKDN